MSEWFARYYEQQHLAESTRLACNLLLFLEGQNRPKSHIHWQLARSYLHFSYVDWHCTDVRINYKMCDVLPFAANF